MQQAVCSSQFRWAGCPIQHVHAARRCCPRLPLLGGCRATAAAAALPASRRRARAAVRANAVEEVVEGIATVEPLGAVPDSHFEQHDQAQQLLQQLNALNSNLSQAIESADIVLETSAWPTLTLPAAVATEFKAKYREARKKDERNEKEERKRRAALREQTRAARSLQKQQQQGLSQAPVPAPAVEQPPAAAAAQAAATEQLSAAQPSQLEAAQAASHAASLAAPQPMQQLPIQQQQQQQPAVTQQQQQPAASQPEVPAPQRTRRTRRSAAVSVAPAAVSSSVLSSIYSSSSSQPSSQAVPQPSPAEPAPAPAASSAAAAAAVAASAAPAVAAPASTPAPVRRGRSRQPVSAAAAEATSSTALSVQQPQQQQQQQPVSSSWAPLPALQLQAPVARRQAAPAAVAAAGASSRRLQRAAGIGRQGGVAAGAAHVHAAPTPTAKLADNTMCGLDMRAELLTSEQEKELAVMVQDLIALEHVARELAVQLGRTPTELEWMEAAAAAQAGAGDMLLSGMIDDPHAAMASFQARLAVGRSAKQAMIKANYKLVVSIARKYQGHGMSMPDLVNEGIAGLVRGVERFEPAKGFKFSTYAHWWIRQAVSRSLAEQGRLVRLPTHMQELLNRASKASKVFEAKHGREPTAEELSPELGVDAGRIRDAWEAVAAPRSLDQPFGGDAEGGTLADVVEDDRTIAPEEAVYIESLKKDLEGVLGHLSARDAGVLRMRYGLLDGKEYTLDEVGAEFKVTRERIRQIEAKAIRELRAHHMDPGSVMADYQLGSIADKQLASRTSSGLKKQK